MKEKQFLALIFAVILAFTIVGCKPEKDKSEISSNNSTSSSENSKTAQLKSQLDFGGETITFCYPPGYDMLNANGTDMELARRDNRMKELEQKYNVVIEQKEGKGTYWSGTAMSIASGSPSGHIMMTQSSHYFSWFKAGAMADLTGAMEKTGIDFRDSDRYNQLVRRYTSIDDGQYGFSNLQLNPTQQIFYFNKRIFEEQNLGNPYEWIKNKEWTWDKFEEVIKKATIRNSDGTVKQWGVGGIDILSVGGVDLAYFDKNGKAQLMESFTDEAINNINKAYKWMYVDKYVYIQSQSASWETTMKEFLKGTMAMCVGTNKLLQFAQESAMEDDFGVLYPPLNKDETEYPANGIFSQFYFIPKTYENMADKLLLLIDDLYEPYKDASYADLIAEKYITRMRDKESLDIFTDMVIRGNEKGLTQPLVPTAMNILNYGDPSVYNMKWGAQKTSPSDYWETYRVAMKKILEDTMEGHRITG